MHSMKKLSIAALAILMLMPACSKKDEGCKLDSECKNGQICRNMKCVDDAQKQDVQPQEQKDTQDDTPKSRRKTG